MGADQLHVDPSGNERFEGRVVGRFGEAVDVPAFQVWNLWRDLETQERAQGEYVISITATVGVVAANCNVVLVVDQRVEHMQRLARGCCDQFGLDSTFVSPGATLLTRIRQGLSHRPVAIQTG